GGAARTAAGARWRGPRHSDALVEDAMRTLLTPALRGERAERELQLFGPPREVLRVRAAPLWRRNRVIGAVAFVRDVSELRRVERARAELGAHRGARRKKPDWRPAPTAR